MRSVSYRLLALAACVAVAGAPRIAAAEIDDDSATKLEQSLNGWLAGLLGPAVDLGERPVHVAASDDHFALEIPIGRSFGDLGAGIDAGPVTASVRPIDGARWAIDKLAMPSPLVFTAPAPQGGGCPRGGQARRPPEAPPPPLRRAGLSRRKPNLEAGLLSL